jgi:4'-phosphopantetheinyl transferase
MRWLARGEIELPDHDRWLSVGERQQVATLRFTKRRQEYLTRRWTAKHAVALALATDRGAPTVIGAEHLAAIEVRNHASGAPWVAVDGRPTGLEISLTDRAGWAVCLVGAVGRTPRGSLGIDLELVEPRSDRFVSDYLTPREQAYVRSRPSEDARHAAANLLWSAKEAALKVLQVGLRADTRTVEVVVHDVRPADATRGDGGDGGWGRLSMAGRAGDRFHGWWRRDGAFLLTTASRDLFDPPDRFPGSADLARAEPLHSWLDQPLA